VDEIDRLVIDLGDEDFSRREAAQRQLAEMGPAAVSRLAAEMRLAADEERRSALQTILRQIEDEAVTGATRVSVEARQTSAYDVIASLAEQSGVRMQLLPIDLWRQDTAPAINLSARRQPLWSVLRRVCDQAGLEPSVTDDGIRLVASGGCGPTRGPGTVSGPLLISAARIHHQRSIELSQGGIRHDEFVIGFNALAEPKLRIMPGPAAVTLSHAFDDVGNSLLLGQQPEISYGAGGPVWSFAVRLRYPEKPGGRIERLGGTILLPVATQFAVVRIDDLAAAQSRVVEAGGMRFAVRHVTQTGDRWEVGLSATTPSNDREDFGKVQQLLYNPDIRLLDAAGRSILRSSGPNFTSSDHPGTLQMAMIFDRNLSDGRPTPGPARSLVWRVPIASKTISLPFEIVDLPMP